MIPLPSMKYAVIEIAGRQFKVKEGDTFVTDAYKTEPGVEVLIDQVHLLSDGDQIQVGNPTLPGVSLKLESVRHFNDEKVIIRRFKAKSRYRKNKGHRQPKTELKVLSIDLGEPKTLSKKAKVKEVKGE